MMSVLTPPTETVDLNIEKHSRAVMPLNSLEDLSRASNTLCKAFEDCPANDYLLKKFFNIPLNEPVSKYRLNSITNYYTAWYHDLGGEVVEANDFDAVAIWSLPNHHLPHTLSDDAQFNKIFFEDLDERKRQVLPKGMDYYYLFIIGKDVSQSHVRGSVRQILNEYKRRADADNCACVLEAISEHAKSVYEYFGYKVFQEFKFGIGEIDSRGHLDPQGEGFTAYLMIYYKDLNVLHE